MNSLRKRVIAEMQNLIGSSQWQHNVERVNEIKAIIATHVIHNHNVLYQLKTCAYSLSEMQVMHLQYRDIVRIFTDALLMASFKAAQVEERFKVGTKAYPRFLLTLNVFDEFGFKYAPDQLAGLSQSAAQQSHLVLFEELLSNLGISEFERTQCPISPTTSALKQTFLAGYSDFLTLILYLCIAEEIVILFSPQMRQNIAALGVDVTSGYYSVHGESSDASNEGCDDYHEDDLLAILTFAIQDSDVPELKSQAVKFLDAWYAFWSQNFSHTAYQ